MTSTREIEKVRFRSRDGESPPEFAESWWGHPKGRHGVRPLQVAAILVVLAGPLLADDPQPAAGPEPPAFELLDGDRVVFLGNTLIERMQRYGYVEAALTARWPDRDVTFRNLGWSGDTVWAESRGLFDSPEKGYERMIAHVGELKPTVIFLGYGNVEAFAGEAGLPAFVKQYEKLMDDLTKVSAAGVRYVLFGPTPHERLPAPLPDPTDFNERARLFANAIGEIAKARSARFIDLQYEFEKSEDRRRSWSEASSKLDVDELAPPLTSDGVHLNRLGHLIVARDILLNLEVRGFLGLCIDVEGQPVSTDYEVTRKTWTRDTRIFTARAPRVPMEGQSFVLVDFPEGNYEVRSDGEVVFAGSSTADWGLKLKGGPDAKQADALRTAIVEKNRLYFHRWRPQNVTYIELFRKHEQGRFTEETAVYDRLIAEKEREIAKLRKPVTRTYELIRVKETKESDK